MTKEEREKLDAHFKIYLADATRFLDNELDACKNEHGAYIYQSPDGRCSIALDSVLSHFKDWLLQEGIVREG